MEAEANINQTVIGQMMGHSQLRTTSRYIANNAAHHRNAISAIGDRISGLENEEQVSSDQEADESCTDSQPSS